MFRSFFSLLLENTMDCPKYIAKRFPCHHISDRHPGPEEHFSRQKNYATIAVKGEAWFISDDSRPKSDHLAAEVNKDMQQSAYLLRLRFKSNERKGWQGEHTWRICANACLPLSHFQFPLPPGNSEKFFLYNNGGLWPQAFKNFSQMIDSPWLSSAMALAHGRFPMVPPAPSVAF